MRLPKHFLVPCHVLCLYFYEQVENPSLLVANISLALSEALNFGDQFELGYAEDLSAGLFKEHKLKDNIQRIASDRLRGESVGLPASAYCISESGCRVGRFFFNYTITEYTANEGWSHSCEGGHGGPCVVVGVASLGDIGELVLDKSFYKSIISVAESESAVCHGVIDIDYYISNRQGYYYTTSVYPTTVAREQASDGWGLHGGVERTKLCRAPREGLVIGSKLASSVGYRVLIENGFEYVADTQCSRRKGNESSMLWTASDSVCWGSSVRNSTKSRNKACELFEFLCSNGYSNREYDIPCDVVSDSSIIWQ